MKDPSKVTSIMVHLSVCPGEDTLLRYIEHADAPSQRERLERHFADCDECRQALAQVIHIYSGDFNDPLGPHTPANFRWNRGESDWHDADPALASTMAQADERGPREIEAGDRLGRYIVLRPIGAGGVGVVYRGYDPDLDRQVALKVLRYDSLADNVDDDDELEEAQARLMREAQAAARLSHPNVVSVYDVGVNRETVFIAMELVEGQSLAQWLAQEPRSWRDICTVFADAGRGLAAIHEAGIVHRDFKPSNVLIDSRGVARITDFGLARLNQHEEYRVLDRPKSYMMDATLTRSGMVVGTPLYMAPEQFDKLFVDHRSDQFAFCVALYEALYRCRPFAGNNIDELADAVCSGYITPPSPETADEHRREIPSWLHKLILRGLSVDAERRFSSMTELVRALTPPRTMRPRYRAALAAVGLALSAAVLGASGYSYLSARWAPSSMAMCAQSAEDKITSSWNDDERMHIRQAFAAASTTGSAGTTGTTGTAGTADADADADAAQASSTFTALSKTFDDYSEAWLTTSKDTCAATHVRSEQSEQMLDVRMHCLDRRLAEMRSLLALMGNADTELMNKAVEAGQALTPVNVCSDRDALLGHAPLALPKDSHARDMVESVRARLDTVKASVDAGRYRDGFDLAQIAIDEARAIGYEPLTAEAHYWLGMSAIHAGEFPRAEPALWSATLLAEASRHDTIAADAWIALVQLARLKDPGATQNDRWVERAQAAVDRLGNNIRRRQRLASELGALAYRRSAYQRALTHWQQAAEWAQDIDDPILLARSLNNLAIAYHGIADYGASETLHRRAIALLSRTVGHKHPLVGAGFNNLTIVLHNLGKYHDAIDSGQRALEISEDALGSQHPNIASILTMTARSLRKLGRYEQAEAYLRRALQVQEDHFGPDSQEVSPPLVSLAATLRGMQRYVEAGDLLRRAIKLRRRHWGKRHLRTASAQLELVRLYLQVGRNAEAVSLAESVVPIFEEAHPTDHVDTTEAWYELGRAYLAHGLPRRAIPHLERTLDALRHLQLPPADRAEIYHALAQALSAAKRTPERVRDLVAQAQASYRIAGDRYASHVAELDAWLQELVSPP